MKKAFSIFLLLAVLMTATLNAFPTSHNNFKKLSDVNTSVNAKEDFVGDLELTGGKPGVKTTITFFQKYLPGFSALGLFDFSFSSANQRSAFACQFADAYLSHIYPTHNFW